MDMNHGKKITGKPWTPGEMQESMVILQVWTDGTTMKDTTIPRWQ